MGLITRNTNTHEGRSNAWAIAGMTRLLTTISKWHPPDNSIIDLEAFQQALADLEASLIRLLARMIECLISQSRDTESGLLKNYLDGDESNSGAWAFGDAAGTVLVTSAIYRLAVLVLLGETA